MIPLQWKACIVLQRVSFWGKAPNNHMIYQALLSRQIWCLVTLLKTPFILSLSVVSPDMGCVVTLISGSVLHICNISDNTYQAITHPRRSIKSSLTNTKAFTHLGIEEITDIQTGLFYRSTRQEKMQKNWYNPPGSLTSTIQLEM